MYTYSVFIKPTSIYLTRSSSVLITSVISKYSRTVLHFLIIFLTSDSSNANNKADVPCKIPIFLIKEILKKIT